MATISELLVKLDADADRLNRELRTTRQRVGQFDRQVSRDLDGLRRRFDGFARGASRALAAAGIAVGFDAAVRGVGRLVSSAAQLADVADQIGVGVEALQELRFAAEQNGSSARDLDDALRRLTRRAGLFAQDGGGPAAKAIEALNLQIRDATGAIRPAEDLFFDVVRSLEDIESTAERSALASQLFGEDAGPRLVPLLAQGEQGIRDLGGEIDALAEKSARRAQEIQEDFQRLSQRISLFAQEVVLEALDREPSGIEIGERAIRERAQAQGQGGGTGGAPRPLGFVVSPPPPIGLPETEDLAAAIERAEDAYGRLQERQSTQAAREAERAIEAQAQAYERLVRQIDPAAARQQDLAEGQAVLFEEYNRGNITLAEYARRVSQLEGFYDQAGQATRQFADRTDRASDAFRGFGRDVESSLGRAILQMEDFRSAFAGLVNDIFRALSRRAVGGLIGNLFSTALGGISSLSNPGDALLAGAPLNPPVPAPRPRAIGGPVTAGQGYLVGERGPELFTPARSGFVTPGAAAGGGGAGPVFNIDARGASVEAVARLERIVTRMNGSIEGRAVGAVQNARRRNPSLFR